MTMSNNLRNPSKHKQWLDNEYQQWINALSECTVHNFKEHPGVRRMLGEPDIGIWAKTVVNWDGVDSDMLVNIERIGLMDDATEDSRASLSRFFRYVHYAQQILQRNPISIVEIGGGVGQFYATLRALGWNGFYHIVDIPEVMAFQEEYLDYVSEQTGLDLALNPSISPKMLLSFYALGEFDDETKESYRQLITDSPHGYIAWNSHSGASEDLSIFSAHDITVTPGLEPGITIIEW